MTAHHRPLQIVEITCFCIPKTMRVDEFACHDAFSQNATHAPGDDYSLIKQRASCTVISEQLGHHSTVAATPLLSSNGELTATRHPLSHPHSRHLVHRDYYSTIPAFSNTSALGTANNTPPLHHSSQQYTYRGPESAMLLVVIPSQASSRHPTWPHARNIFCMDPTHHKPTWCARCSLVSDFGWARIQDPHHKCLFFPGLSIILCLTCCNCVS